MAYKALYNKYRPRTFEEVYGQHAIVKTLKNSIMAEKIAHAYLFTGPRGTGKTSMARLFAKALNCEEGLGHQCNHCSNCEALNNGAHPDVIEIDGASNNGVEQVRDLIEKVRYSPIKGKWKIYIIDEVHMMTDSAFNALLKTLEEPPEHVVFILATTEPHKVLPTILSRCQRYDFGKIDDVEISDRIEEILSIENVAYEKEAVSLITSLSDGGMRDALSLLDQALAYGGDSIKESDVLNVFGLASVNKKIELLNLIDSGKTAEVLTMLNAMVESGVDIKRLTYSLLDILKETLIYQRTAEVALLTVLKEEQAKSLGSAMKPKQINALINILLKTTIDFKTVSSIRSLFELSVLEMINVFDENIEVASPVAETKKEPVKQVLESPIKPVEQSKEPQPIEKAEPVKEEPLPSPQAKEETYNPDKGGVYQGNTAPDFLLDEEQTKTNANEITPSETVKPETMETPKEEPKQPSIDVSSLPVHSLVSEGTPITLSDEDIVKVMVTGRKYRTQRQALREQWAELENLKFNEKFQEVAALLCEGRPFCLGEQVLLVNFNFTKHKNKANLFENQSALSEIMEKLIGRKLFVYGLDRSDSNRTQTLYYSYEQINKLPSLEECVLKLPEGGK